MVVMRSWWRWIITDDDGDNVDDDMVMTLNIKVWTSKKGRKKQFREAMSGLVPEEKVTAWKNANFEMQVETLLLDLGCDMLRDGWPYENRWIFGKVPKGGGGHFQIEILCCRFWAFKKNFLQKFSLKMQHNFSKMREGEGSKVVWNFSENSSVLLPWPVPKTGIQLSFSFSQVQAAHTVYLPPFTPPLHINWYDLQ